MRSPQKADSITLKADFTVNALVNALLTPSRVRHGIFEMVLCLKSHN